MKKACCVLLAMMTAASWLFAQEDTTEVKQGWLGVYTENLSWPMLIALNIEHGVLVTEVAEGSPAQAAGFEVGDVIIELDGQPVEDGQSLRALVRDRPEKKVVALIRRRGQERRIIVTLGARKETKWIGHFDFPQLPGVLHSANTALRKAVAGMKQEFQGLSLDSLRKEISELRAEVDRLKKKLEEQLKEE
ncbi:MAG: PDZ domain-containing protein [candidate division WOR-3 bacterium]